MAQLHAGAEDAGQTMLPGGSASKIGHRYETWWTVCELLRMLRGDTEEIRIEPPGNDKTEFVVTTVRHREYHQVKRSHPNGKWSFAALRSVGLLQFVFKVLDGIADRFVFVSGSEARELSELGNSARDAVSVDEFEHRFLGAAQRKRNFHSLCDYWGCNASIAIGMLKRIDVRTIDEIGMEREASWATTALFVADSHKIMSELRAIVADSVHHIIDRNSLRRRLAKLGYTPRRVKTPEQSTIALEQATDHYLDGVRSRLIHKKLVPNDAVESILAQLSATDCVLTGSAGTGKTACVIELVDTLRARLHPVLAFRLDRISSLSTTVALGEELGLEESPSFILAEAVRITGRPGVLIVDQLDAVSPMSGRSATAFDLVQRLIQEVRGARVEIHIVVVCRTFDWKNDSQLRGLLPDDATHVEVTEFPIEQVKQFLKKAGFNSSLFQGRQLELLRLPQNLALFLDSGYDPSIEPGFDTVNRLFAAYWKYKRGSVEGAAGQDQWMLVIETLCDRINSTQHLWVLGETLDSVSSTYLDRIVSEGVLTFGGGRYGFGHESFFDYCYARLFMGRSESIVSFIKATEQHLFRRSQVRQILTYLRSADRSRYERELEALLSASGVRVHIKELAFTLLAEVVDPTEGEWHIWMAWTTKALNDIAHGTLEDGNLHSLAWRRLFSAESWFSYIDRCGRIEHWLSSGSDGLVDLAVSYLRAHHVHHPDRAAALLVPYVDCGGKWIDRLSSFMRFTSPHASRGHFELLLRLVDNGALDKIGSACWSMLSVAGNDRVNWVPEFVAHYLQRRFVRAAADGSLDNRLIGYDQTASRVIHNAAELAPAEFVKHILPVILHISDSSLTTTEPPRCDAVWRTFRTSDHEPGEHACLSALARALAELAREGHCSIPRTIVKLHSRDTYIANYLLQAVYRGAASRFADEAASALCDQQWRLQCGFQDRPYWFTMKVIKSIIAHCSAHVRNRIQDAIVNYVGPYERPSMEYRCNAIGHAAFQLLSAIPHEIRSIQANRRFGELERRFGAPDAKPIGVVVGAVESPISETATAAMTDEQWRLAIKKHCSHRPRHSVSNILLGGALQLSQALERRTKENPERFSRLILTLPVDANPVYLEHVLSALRDAPINSGLKLEVCIKAYAESPAYCGKSIADVIGSISDPLPQDAVDMLCWLGTEHKDPEKELWFTDAGSGRPYYGGDIYSHGINCARGRAAQAIQRLILTDRAYVDRFRPTIERMIFDRSVAVRSCVAGVLRAVGYHDHSLGVSLFRRMDLTEDRLLATVHVDDFINEHLGRELPVFRPTIERMLRSSEPEVCTVGGRLASVAAVLHEDADDLGDQALRGSRHHRLGVAQVAAVNVSKFREWCEPRLTVLFDDEDSEVREEAARCFGRLPPETLSSYEDLIHTFCNSDAFAEGEFWLLSALEKAIGRLPGMTCLACERSLSTPTGDKHIAAKLIFRTYQQHQNDEWGRRSLDLIDKLCFEEPWWADRQLEEFER